ncbi:hypothetical protein Poli38472_004465 [Pythium oligandrum]|uniref:Pre-mRNA-splicing factor 38 n=1 Tax=Pythium oligandrum TaxID=41045 RepID=A0A8K1CAH7_PYTOL|nr:hypothetical protein Poli38472_004465 [Pythium oligandrum]|eukprot:TMW59396.1 hypothetical protein Poli38472_004465 [Pythium oligandrum]
MSRSALTRHALHKSLAQQSQPAVDEEEHQRRVKNDEIPIYGNETTYNLNTLLHQNILQSPYFHELYKFKTYHEVVDEIYYRVDHAEPFAPGTARMPSTCFCLLFKCFTMRLTVKQMNGLLKHTDSPYIRAIGFLYLRYAGEPEELWKWFAPYLNDTEEFNASANPNDKTTIGKWLKGLLEENNYFGTILPRIPKKHLDNIKVRLLLHDRCQEREQANLSIVKYLKPGTKVRALYADDENEPAMYEAVIDSVEEDNQFWVTFPDRSRSRSASPRTSKSGGLTDDLMAQVREQERRKAAAVGKDYAARPASYKGSLSLKLDRYTTRKQSPTKRTEPARRPSNRSNAPTLPDATETTSKPAEVSREAQERMKKLREMYGDASKKAGEEED